MKTFKRTIAFICAIIILCAGTTVSAEQKSCDCGHSPVIMISGFGATTLTLDGEIVFPPTLDTIKELLSEYGLDIGKGLVEFLTSKDIDAIGPHLIALVKEIIEPIRMNPDGSSFYDIRPVISGAGNTSLDAFRKNDMLSFVPYTGSEFLDMEMIGEKIGDDHVFNFTYDWRLSNEVVADQLLEYIEDVRRITGHDKVSVYSISQGSLLFGQYLYKYADKGYIDNCVFDTPLMTGSDLVSDIITENEICINPDVLLSMLSAILHTEKDLTFLSSIFENETIKFVIDYGAKNVIIPVVLYAPAFWEMLPVGKLQHYADIYLDETENKELLALIGSVHNGFMSNVSATLHRAENFGASVAVKSSYGYPLFSGTYESSDGVVNLEHSCGATVCEWGKTFADDYVQVDQSKKYSISPDRTVDLSTAFYPERTWLVSDLFHGQVEWDKPSLKLVCELLLTDNIVDAYSHHEYPQFMTGYMPNSDVALVFDSTNSGFLALNNGTSVTLTNTSLSDPIVIKNVRTQNGSFVISDKFPMYLRAGQSVTLNPDIPDNGKAFFDTVEIVYTTTGLSAKENVATFGISAIDNYGGVIKSEHESRNYKSNIFDNVLIFLTLLWEKVVALFSDL
ncbi:MAG: hypothetical protein IJB86_09150 [Clostridia bacterium]|nr:hypothetical protein [Clostridia bacterium]